MRSCSIMTNWGCLVKLSFWSVARAFLLTMLSSDCGLVRWKSIGAYFLVEDLNGLGDNFSAWEKIVDPDRGWGHGVDEFRQKSSNHLILCQEMLHDCFTIYSEVENISVIVGLENLLNDLIIHNPFIWLFNGDLNNLLNPTINFIWSFPLTMRCCLYTII